MQKHEVKTEGKTLKILSAAATAGTVLFAVPLYLFASRVPSPEQKKIFYHRNFAHRGLHTEDKVIPENSLAAFERAAFRGYGIELDVQLSKDGEVVVFHDDTLDRVCGVEGRVDAYTLSELQKMSLEGTIETIPLFREVLDLVNGRGPLIVELKTTPRKKELCRKTLEILRGYKGDYCIESFNPFIVRWFRHHAPDIMRGQLAMLPEKYEDFPWYNRMLMGYCLDNFLGRPHFIAYEIGKRPLPIRLMQKSGTMLFGWTPHDDSTAKENDGMIFEFYEPDLYY